MKKRIWIQKVEMDICEHCYNELFFGAGDFKEKDREENFYEFLEGQKWAYDGWDDIEPDMVPEHTLFCCDMCGSICEQDKYRLSASRIVNADQFEDFIEAATLCARYISDMDSEWDYLRDICKNYDPEDQPKDNILKFASIVLDNEEEFDGFCKEYLGEENEN